MISSARLTATDEAALVLTAGRSTFANDEILVHNIGSATAYVGGSTVTAADGYPIAAGEVVGLTLTRRSTSRSCGCATPPPRRPLR